jgi:hypothetical protein
MCTAAPTELGAVIAEALAFPEWRSVAEAGDKAVWNIQG